MSEWTRYAVSMFDCPHSYKQWFCHNVRHHKIIIIIIIIIAIIIVIIIITIIIKLKWRCDNCSNNRNVSNCKFQPENALINFFFSSVVTEVKPKMQCYSTAFLETVLVA